MSLSDSFPEWIPLLLLFVLELLWAALTGPTFPGGMLMFLAGYAVSLLVAIGLLVLLPRLNPPRWSYPLLVSGALALKLLLVAGVSSSTPLLAGVTLVPLVVFGLDRILPGRGGDPRAWAMLVGLAALISTDALKVLWLQTGGGSGTAPARTLLALLGLTAGMIVLVRSWSRLRSYLAVPRRAAVALLVSVALVAAGTGWVHGGGFYPGGSHGADKLAGDPPNIILISVDTLRWDMVPPRARKVDLPHLENLKRDSLTFRTAVSVNDWTLPTHASLLTGLIPPEHGVQRRQHRIRESVRYFPRFLRREGYRTAAFTDGGLVHRDYGFGRGFEVYWHHGDTDPFGPYRSFVPGGVELAGVLSRPVRNRPSIQIRHRPPRRVGTPRKHYFSPNLRLARDWIQRVGGEKSPYFLFLHTYEAHDHNRLDHAEKTERLAREFPRLARALEGEVAYPEPVTMSDSGWRRFVDEIPRALEEPGRERFRTRIDDLSPETRAFLRSQLGGWSPVRQRRLARILADVPAHGWDRFLEFSSEKKKVYLRRAFKRTFHDDLPRLTARAKKTIYGYSVENTQKSLGNFLAWLKDRGDYEDSLIVFLSDHGEGFKLVSRRMLHNYGSLEETLTRVPLWIKLPGNRGRRTTVNHPVALRDVFPIVLKHLGVQEPCVGRVSCRDADWSSRGPLSVPRRDHLWTSVASDLPANRSRDRSDKRVKLGVRGDTYKLISLTNPDTGTFLKISPENLEEHRLPAGEVPEEVRRRLLEAMERHRALHERYPDPFEREGNELSEDLRKDLEGLGYL